MKMIPIFILALAVFLALPLVSAIAGEYNWDFSNSSNYIYNSSEIIINNGLAYLNGTDNPVYSLWHLNEGNGTIVNDSSGNNRDGIIIANATWVAGKLNNALQFNGATQYVNFTNTSLASFERTEAHSYEFWIKTATIPSTYGNILGRYDATNVRGFTIYIDNLPKVVFLEANAVSNYLQVRTSATNVVNGSWHHIIVTYDGSSSSAGVKIYIDGVSQTVDVPKDNLGGTSITAESFKIGKDSANNYFTGNLDEVTIYNKVLSQSDVSYRYNSGLGTENSLAVFQSGYYSIQPKTNFSFPTKLMEFNESATKIISEIRYSVILDGSPFYWNDSSWVASNGNWTQSNNASVINTNIGKLASSGNFSFKALLHSTDGTYSPYLDNIFTSHDLKPPTCILVSRTPAKINDSSTGIFNVIINCTDPSGINITKTNMGSSYDHYWMFITRTLEENIISGLPNYWSVRYPNNSLSVVDPYGILQKYKVLMAEGRNLGFWYENLTDKTESVTGKSFNDTILNDTFSYAIDDGGNYGDLVMQIEGNASTSILFNITSLVEVATFRQMFYLNKHDMGSQQKYNATLTNNTLILTKSFDFEALLNSNNYTMNIFRDLSYGTPNPTLPLLVYYCNSSFNASTITIANLNTSFENYNTGDDGSLGNAYAGYQTAQTFTPSINHTITSVTLKLFRNGNPSQISVGIYATTNTTAGIYFPTGSALVNNDTQPDPTSTNASEGAWEMYSFGSGYNLTAGVTYTIKVSTSGGNVANSVGWRADTTSPTYSGGMAGRSTSAGAWSNSSMDMNTDGMFYENGSVTTLSVITPNCVFLENLLPANITSYYNYLNSSYIKSTYSVTNGKIGNIVATPEYYFLYLTSSIYSYYLRYANGSTVTGIPFSETNVSWTSNNNGNNWTQAKWTPDVFTTTTKKVGDEFQFGIYVCDVLGNCYSNFSFFTDIVTTINHKISTPQIYMFNSSSLLNDANLNGVHKGNMNIFVLPAIDIDSIGNVTHNLSLFNTDGTFNRTINGSFLASGDTSLWINFNTSLVPDGKYRMNIFARSGDNYTDVKNSTTVNFTIDNTPPYFINITDISINDNEALNVQFNASDNIALSCYSLNDTSNFQITCDGLLTNKTSLSANQYFLNITINDTANNLNSTVILIDVLSYIDYIPPYFITIPAFANLGTGDNLSVVFRAGDNKGFGIYSINDTRFAITQDIGNFGYLINIVPLPNGNYSINVTINDTSNNINSTIYIFSVSTKIDFIFTPTENTYLKSSSIRLSSFCFDTNFNPCSSDVVCSLNIYYPNSSLLVNNGLMNWTSTSYYYDLSSLQSSMTGNYNGLIRCSIGKDSRISYFVYIISYTGNNINDDVYNIPNNVWNFGNKNLTYYPTTNVSINPQDIWEYPVRNLTYYPLVNITNATVYVDADAIANAVWNYNGIINNNILNQFATKMQCVLNSIINPEGWGVNIAQC